LHMPVVPGPASEQGLFGVLLRHSDECSAGEAWHGREVERGEDAVRVHVVDAKLGIVGSRTKLVEGTGLHAIFAARTADDRIEPDGRVALSVPEPDILAIILD